LAPELPSEFISTHIDIVIDQLNQRKRHLQMMQEGEWANRMAMAMVDPRTSERFWRAETQAERRMYRALSALAANAVTESCRSSSGKAEIAGRTRAAAVRVLVLKAFSDSVPLCNTRSSRDEELRSALDRQRIPVDSIDNELS